MLNMLCEVPVTLQEKEEPSPLFPFKGAFGEKVL